MRLAWLALVTVTACASIANLDEFRDVGAQAGGGADQGGADAEGGGGTHAGGGPVGGGGTAGAGGQGVTAYRDAILAGPGLVSYWRLGDSASTAAKNLIDSSADGTYLGDLTAHAGLVGDTDGATRFQPGNGKMVVGANKLDFFDSFANGGFTIELWFKPDLASGTLISLRADGATTWSFRLRLEASTAARVLFDLTVPNSDLVATLPMDLDETAQVHHLAASWSGGGESPAFQACLILDDVTKCGDENTASFSVPNQSADLVVGAEQNVILDGTQSHFVGVIDEVAIYTPMLDPAVISLHNQLGRMQ
ncbi:MAG: LamG-like jellyroll fold domain-containing protein [Polyangiaceae bacterium]